MQTPIRSEKLALFAISRSDLSRNDVVRQATLSMKGLAAEKRCVGIPITWTFDKVTIVLPVINETTSLAETVETIIADAGSHVCEVLIVVCGRTEKASLDLIAKSGIDTAPWSRCIASHCPSWEVPFAKHSIWHAGVT